MSAASMAAIAAAATAVIGALFRLPSRWFCGLLALSALLIGLDAALRGLAENWVLSSLLVAAVFSGAALHAVITEARRRRTP
ncbi:hypothetical protein ABZX77_05775 [Streptomyces sp. NPDC004237]|uniref:hypothetical protein n=1 Tax=Streptomyces sp. NPDC004237 TaxID=3154455 RepID=UPI0033A1E266